MLLHNQLQDTKAGPMFQEALAMRRRCYGDDTKYFDLLAASPDPNNVASNDVFIPHPELCLSYCHLGMHAVSNRGTTLRTSTVHPVCHGAILTQLSCQNRRLLAPSRIPMYVAACGGQIGRRPSPTCNAPPTCSTCMPRAMDLRPTLLYTRPWPSVSFNKDGRWKHKM